MLKSQIPRAEKIKTATIATQLDATNDISEDNDTSLSQFEYRVDNIDFRRTKKDKLIMMKFAIVSYDLSIDYFIKKPRPSINVTRINGVCIR